MRGAINVLAAPRMLHMMRRPMYWSLMTSSTSSAVMPAARATDTPRSVASLIDTSPNLCAVQCVSDDAVAAQQTLRMVSSSDICVLADVKDLSVSLNTIVVVHGCVAVALATPL